MILGTGIRRAKNACDPREPRLTFSDDEMLMVEN
jgi:hypothetical protein